MDVKQILQSTIVKQESEDIICVDDYVSIKQEAEEWDSKVRRHLQDLSFGCERKLDSTMKWYIEQYGRDHDILLKLTFEIVTQVESSEKLQRQINQMCRKLIYSIKLYLLCREDRALHVLMKMNVNVHSNECKSFMNHLYRAFLRREPKDKSDLAFCRAYILFQQWKKINDKWHALDALLYTMFNRTPEDLQTNETLRHVILLQHNSILDALAHIDNDNLIMVRKYFEMIQPENIQDINYSQSDIEELEEEIDVGLAKPEEDPDLEEYFINYRKSMDSVPRCNTGQLKEENESDDDCQFVGVVHNAPEIIHEISDDDDIQEVVIFKQNITVHDSSDSLSLNTVSKPDKQIRLSTVLNDEITSWTGKKENDHDLRRKTNNNIQQPSPKHQIDENLSRLLTPPSDDGQYENVAELSTAVAETVVTRLSDSRRETITGTCEMVDDSPSTALQSKNISTMPETSNSEGTDDSETRDEIHTSTPLRSTIDLRDMFFSNSNTSEALSEALISSPSSSNLPNPPANRTEDPYGSPNHPDISSTTCTEGTEQCTIIEKFTNTSIDISYGALNDITMRSPNPHSDATIEDAVSDDIADSITKPSCTNAADVTQKCAAKGPELALKSKLESERNDQSSS
nr:unnamed protein product [Callosobruchus analis]